MAISPTAPAETDAPAHATTELDLRQMQPWREFAVILHDDDDGNPELSIEERSEDRMGVKRWTPIRGNAKDLRSEILGNALIQAVYGPEEDLRWVRPNGSTASAGPIRTQNAGGE